MLSEETVSTSKESSVILTFESKESCEETVSVSHELSPTFTFETLTNESLKGSFFNCGFPYEEIFLLDSNVALLSVNAGFFLKRVVCVSNVLMTLFFFIIIDGNLDVVELVDALLRELAKNVAAVLESWRKTSLRSWRAGEKRRCGLVALKNYKFIYDSICRSREKMADTYYLKNLPSTIN